MLALVRSLIDIRPELLIRRSPARRRGGFGDALRRPRRGRGARPLATLLGRTGRPARASRPDVIQRLADRRGGARAADARRSVRRLATWRQPTARATALRLPVPLLMPVPPLRLPAPLRVPVAVPVPVPVRAPRPVPVPRRSATRWLLAAGVVLIGVTVLWIALGRRRVVTVRLDPAAERLGLVGGRRSPWGSLEHIDRMSGSIHRSPVSPRIVGDHAYLPLPADIDVDWARNVRTAGHCRLQVHETVYELDEPATVAAAEHPALSRWNRRIQVARGAHYLRLKVLSEEPGTLETVATGWPAGQPAGEEAGQPAGEEAGQPAGEEAGQPAEAEPAPPEATGSG